MFCEPLKSLGEANARTPLLITVLFRSEMAGPYWLVRERDAIASQDRVGEAVEDEFAGPDFHNVIRNGDDPEYSESCPCRRSSKSPEN